MRSRRRTYLLVVALLLLLPVVASSQTGRPSNTYRATIADTAPRHAPRIHADRTVTLSVNAPEATKVELRLAGRTGLIPMSRDTDGVWRVTLGPLEPEVYTYTFVVNGVTVIDPSNPEVNIGRSSSSSLLDIPGSPARFDERQSVPRGALHIREYNSDVVKLRRRVVVYVPPQYDTEPVRRFPVLYLRHGNGGLEDGWSNLGRAGVILDNLLAQGKAVPMLIVMPNGYPSAGGAGSGEEGVDITGSELMLEIIPLVEKHYRVLASRESRAIAGLSMGATQAFLTGLRHLDTFAWVAAFSAGTIGDADFELETAVPGFFGNPEARRSLRLLYLSCGTEDPRYAGHLDVVEALRARNVPHEWFGTPGGHEWKVWRHSLADLLPRLFRPAPGSGR